MKRVHYQMTATLWKTDPRTAQDILRYLRNKALLLTGERLDVNVQTYRIHDLLHDLCINLIIDPIKPSNQGDIPGLGLKLKEAHSYLLGCYREKCRQGFWHTLPNDGYIHENLVWHMEKADRLDYINCLLSEETVDGKNAWYQTRELLGQIGGYIENIFRSWDIMETCSLSDIEKSNATDKVGLETRYALMISSINNLVSNVPPDLILYLVKNKFWTPKKGVIYAQKIENNYFKVKVLSEIMSHITDPEKKDILNECMAIIEVISDDKTRTDALIEVILHHPKPDEIPDLVNQIKDRNLKDSALAKIIPNLSDSQLILNLIRQIDDGMIKGRTIVKIVPRLREPRSLLHIVDQIRDEGVKSKVLVDIAPYFPYKDEILASAYKINKVSLRKYTVKTINYTYSRSMRSGIRERTSSIISQLKYDILRHIPSEVTEINNIELQKINPLILNTVKIGEIKDEFYPKFPMI